MNIIQENIDEVNAVLKVKVVASDYLPKVEVALKDAQKRMNIPGFRAGKVPAGMIKKKYGKSIMVDEISKLINDSLTSYLRDNKIEVLGNPLPKESQPIDWDNQEEFEFLYEMGLAPKFNVDITSKDKLTYETVRIDEDLTNNYIKDISRRYGKVANAEVSEDGDFLNGDFVELDANGEIIPGGVFHTGSLFISRITHEATKKSLIGLKVGDKVVLNPKNIAETSDALATIIGIDKKIAETFTASLQFTIKGLTRIQPAEINQDFFDKLYGPGVINSEEEFKAKIKDELNHMFQQDSENKFHNRAVDYLMKKISFNLPDDFLKRWILYNKEKETSNEEIEKEYAKSVEGIKWQLIESKIMTENDIKVTSGEIMDFTKDAITKQFLQYNQMEPSEEELTETVKRVLSDNEETKKIGQQLLHAKLINFYKSKFSIENKEVSQEEFYANK